MIDTPIIYTKLGDDPFTCPYDGARTDQISDNNVIYQEKCRFCEAVFNFEFDDEDDL